MSFNVTTLLAGKETTLTVGKPNGMIGTYHIYEGEFYRGMVTRSPTGWRVYFQSKGYTEAERMVILDQVLQHKKFEG